MSTHTTGFGTGDQATGAGAGAGPLDRPLKPHEAYVPGHHWRNATDEAEGAKLGMWLFLATEILLFAGFFCAYAAFRLFYPDNWHEASRYYLDWEIGAINTGVLLLSSFTIVMAIRAAQLDQKWACFWNLTITNACAVFFLITKVVLEYIPKIKKGALPGGNFNYNPYKGMSEGGGQAALTHGAEIIPIADAAAKAGEAAAHTPMPHDHIFMSVYWISTATHGFHVLVGVLLIGWLMIRTLKDHFGPNHYTTLENVGLYWHVVDVIWIFLFPLLYLV
jgi:cytochrome c oxidase subunit III